MSFMKGAPPSEIILFMTGTAARRNAVWQSFLAIGRTGRQSRRKIPVLTTISGTATLLGRHFPTIAEYQKAVALEKGNMEANCNLTIRLDNVGIAFLAMQSYEAFCKFARLTFPVQQKDSYERHQKLLHEAKRPGDEKAGPR